MADIAAIGNHLADILKHQKVDFIEAHLDQSRTSHITYRGRELESIGRSSSFGGNVRAMVRGAWGFASFNDVTDLESRVASAVSMAQFAGRGETHLAAAAPIVDSVPLEFENSPVDIPLTEKKALMDEYNEVIWGTPNIRTSVIGYGDGEKTSVYINSLGSLIRQERADVTLRVAAIAAADGEVQQAGVSIGSKGDFNAVRGRHAEVADLAQRAVALLAAPQLAGGVYTVVLDPVLAGVFTHEAFGHLSESDFIYENDRLLELMALGKQFGSRDLNIVDGASMPGLRGSYKYDDEGTPATLTDLIREGKLVGRLHSRETAARMGEKPTGNARAVNYRYAPIVRMTNTYIMPGTATLNDLIKDVKEGVYAKNWYGGTTSMEMFTFSAGEAYRIQNGQIGELVRPVTLSGNVFQTLENIDGIGNDLAMNEGGGCGKGGQSPLPVSNGSPHIRIQNCLVGGK